MKHLLITILLAHTAIIYAHGQPSITQNSNAEFNFQNTGNELSGPVVTSGVDNTSGTVRAGKALKTVGIVVGCTGAGVALLDYFVLKTPGYPLAKAGMAASLASIPLACVGVIMQTSGNRRSGGSSLQAGVSKTVSLAVVPGGIGIYIDL